MNEKLKDIARIVAYASKIPFYEIINARISAEEWIHIVNVSSFMLIEIENKTFDEKWMKFILLTTSRNPGTINSITLDDFKEFFSYLSTIKKELISL